MTNKMCLIVLISIYTTRFNCIKLFSITILMNCVHHNNIVKKICLVLHEKKSIEFQLTNIEVSTKYPDLEIQCIERLMCL